MGDLISRQAVIDALGDAHFKNYGNAIMVIQSLPSAEPVRHGKWVEHVDDRWGASHYFCSECGEKPLKEERTNRRCLSNFCPNCGARMDKE